MFEFKKGFKLLMLSKPDLWEEAFLKRVANCAHWESSEENLTLLHNEWDLVIVDMDVVKKSFLKKILQKRLFPFYEWTPFLFIGQADSLQRITLNGFFFNRLVFRPAPVDVIVNSIKILWTESEAKRHLEQRIILAIGAHPDDIEFGMGGSLALFRDKGHKLHYVCVSEGEVGGDPTIRKKESKLSSELLGVEGFYIKNFHDTHIDNDFETIKYIHDLVNNIAPTHVFTHTLHDNHQDHRAVHLASVIACREVPNLFAYQSPSINIDFRPTFFVEISSGMEKKLRLIKCFKSQNKKPYLNQRMVRANAQYWGANCGYGLAEAFEVIRMTFREGH